jgi:hypothetical protein
MVSKTVMSHKLTVYRVHQFYCARKLVMETAKRCFRNTEYSALLRNRSSSTYNLQQHLPNDFGNVMLKPSSFHTGFKQYRPELDLR